VVQGASFALGSTTAAIGLNIMGYDVAEHSTTLSTLQYQANTNYDPCSCDMTSKTCDAFCCCDSDCSEESKTEWNDKKMCQNIVYSNYRAQIFSDC